MCVKANPSPKLLRAEIAFRSCCPEISPTFITFHKYQLSQAPSQVPDSVYSGWILSLPDRYHLFRTDIISSGQISSLPDGYHLFRTGSIHTKQMLDIRGISGIS